MTYHEHVFPYHSNNSSWSYHSTHPIPKPTSDTSLPLTDDFDLVTVSTPPHTTSSDDSTNHTDTTDPSPNPDSGIDNSNLADSVPLETVDQVDSVDSSIVPLRHSTNLSLTSSKPSSPGILYPISHYHSCANLSATHSKFALSVNHDVEPVSYSQASTQDCWVKAMNAELEALKQNKTWVLVDKPANVKPIGSRWVYKVKHKADGSIERYKARLVAKGYTQVEGIDFFETFSHVAKITTVRFLLALAAIQNWNLHQLDVNNAFLHGDLHEDVYMNIPQGVSSPKPNQVCKLLKSLYGFKQASRKWYEKLTGVLIAQGYTQATSDHSLFTLHRNSTFTALLVYVDDIILAGNSLAEFTRIKQLLDSQFKIKDLGQLKYFLGIEVAHSQDGISIRQRKYCLDLLHDTCLLGAKPAKTPLDPSVKLHQDKAKPFTDISGYRRLVGKLLYLTTTRPDIAFVTQQLSQFLTCPTYTHSDTACRVVRYLKNSPGKGLLFRRDSTL
jgi:hypothetical protein